MDSSPLSECEQDGDHLNYPGSHIRVWERWQQLGKAPAETEYEEFPRGRTIYNALSGFAILTDACIRKRKDLIAAITNEFHLPKKTSVGGDPHYRCFHCLHGNAEDEE